MSIDALNNSKVANTANALSDVLSAAQQQSSVKQNELGKDAFLKMLVEQLKNQDPTEPVKNEELAVNLAQFSQVEQLVEINEKLGSGGIGETASLAGLLGREVLVEGNSLDVRQGNAGSVFFELPVAVSSGGLQIVDRNGNVVAEKDLGALSAGRQVVKLSDLGIPDGNYQVAVTAQSLSGDNFSPSVSSGGVVTGFIPGADPTLLMGDREIKVADIRLVSA